MKRCEGGSYAQMSLFDKNTNLFSKQHKIKKREGCLLAKIFTEADLKCLVFIALLSLRRLHEEQPTELLLPQRRRND